MYDDILCRLMYDDTLMTQITYDHHYVDAAECCVIITYTQTAQLLTSVMKSSDGLNSVGRLAESQTILALDNLCS